MTALATLWRILGIRGAIAVGLGILWLGALASIHANLTLQGPFGWQIGYEGWKHRSARFEAALDKVAEDAVAARIEQERVMQAEQDRLDNLAERANDDHETTRIIVRDATDRFIADNRVRPDNQCVPSGASAPASGDSAAVPVAVPATVVMDSADVRACGDLYAYALAGHLWAVGLADED